MKNAPATNHSNESAQTDTERTHYSTDTAAQRQRLLAFLIERPVNTMYARDMLNIMAPAARVKELREAGHDINTHRITITDRDGRDHRGVAVYTLLKIAEGAA